MIFNTYESAYKYYITLDKNNYTIVKKNNMYDVTLIIRPEPTIEEQNENIRKTRQKLYYEVSDPLKLDYDESIARNEPNAEEKKQLWLESKDKIRNENPYIEKENKI